MRRATCLTIVMVLGLFVASQSASGQTSQVRGDAYLLAAGKNYNKHAYDHARILKQYASTGEPVSGDIVMEHATAMRAAAKSAGKSYSKLSSATTSDADAGKRITEMQNRLNMLDDKLEQLQAECTKTKELDAQRVTELSTQVSRALKANRLDNDQAYQTVNPNDGGSWYTDGSFDE